MGEDSEEEIEPRTVAKPGRTCTEPGCGALLSVYNGSDRCSLHPENIVPAWRKRRNPKGS